MARNFVSGSGQFLENTSAVLTGTPLTMACWVKPSSLTNTPTFMSLEKSTASTWHALAVDGAGNVRARTFDGTTSTEANKAGVGTGTWQHVAGVWTSSTSRTAYYNGTAGTTDATSSAPSGINRTEIGQLLNGGAPVFRMDGDIAECGIWNISLSAADIASLAAGVSPLFVRPDALVFYAPLHGEFSPEIDVVGRFNMTVTGATASTTSPAVFNKSIQVQPPPASGTTTPSTLSVVLTTTATLLTQKQFVRTLSAAITTVASLLASVLLRSGNTVTSALWLDGTKSTLRTDGNTSTQIIK